MTKKRGLDKFLSSIFGDHIDPENSEIVDNKNDTEKNVDKILQLINEEESDVPSLNSLPKSELVSLIKNVRKGYRDLYERYDGLTEKLKKNIHQHDKIVSFKSSSDSESSDSGSEISSKKSKDYKVQQEQLQDAKALQFENLSADLEEIQAKNRKLEDELQNMMDSVKALEEDNRDLNKKLEVSIKEKDKLKQRIDNFQEQNESLILENKEVASKLREGEKIIEEYKIEMRQMKDKLVDLESNNMSLKQESDERAQEVAKLNQQMDSTIKDYETLRSQNFEFMSKIQEVEKSRDERTVQMKLATDDFSLRITQLSSENERLKVDLEAASKNGQELTRSLEDLNQKLSMELEEAKNKYSEAYGELKSEHETTKKEAMELKQILEAMDNEKNSLQVQNEKLDLELQATNLQLTETKNELGAKIAQVEKLTSENTRLYEELELKDSMHKELVDKLERVIEENTFLKEQKHKLQEAVNNSSAEIEQLTTGNEHLEIKANHLTQRLEIANQQVSELRKEVGFADEEKKALFLKLEQIEGTVETHENNGEELRAEKSMLQEKNKEFHEKNTNLEKELEAAKMHILTLQEKFEEAQSEAAARIQTVSADRDDLLSRLQLLHQQNSEMQDQMKVTGEICLQSQIMMEELESKLISRISSQESMLENLISQFHHLLKDCKHLKYLLQEYFKKLEVMESVKEEQSKEIKKLANVRLQLLEKVKLAEAENEETSREILKLQYHNEALEVGSRLAHQNLHVTRAENKEMEEKLQKKSRELESLAGKLGLLQNELHNVEATLKSRISDFCAELSNMEFLFDKNQSYLENRLSLCIKELEILKTNLEKQLCEKQEMVDQIPELRSKLEACEDRISTLEHEAVGLTIQLVEKRKEVEKLARRTTECNKMLAIKEQTVKEKEEEIVERTEEKLEAIRQLCMQIEYHREIAQYYQEYISKILLKRGR